MTFLNADLLRSPLGDQRQRPVLCQKFCGEETFNWAGVCVRCAFATDPEFAAARILAVESPVRLARLIAEGGGARDYWADPNTRALLRILDETLIALDRDHRQFVARRAHPSLPGLGGAA